MPMSANISGREYHKFVQSPTRADGSAIEITGQVSAEITDNGTKTITFGSAASVASASTSALISYTVPALKQFKLSNVVCGGSNIAKYEIKINASTVLVLRTNFGGELHASLNFNSIILNAADTILIEVTNNRPYAGDFESTMIGTLSDV